MRSNQSSNLGSADTKEDRRVDRVVVHLNMKRATQIVVCNIAETRLNRTEGTVTIMEGARVVTSDGKSIGTVEGVLAKPETNGPTDYWIASGLLLNEKRRVPVEWIESLGHDEVRLAVGSSASAKISRGAK